VGKVGWVIGTGVCADDVRAAKASARVSLTVTGMAAVYIVTRVLGGGVLRRADSVVEKGRDQLGFWCSPLMRKERA